MWEETIENISHLRNVHYLEAAYKNNPIIVIYENIDCYICNYIYHVNINYVHSI